MANPRASLFIDRLKPGRGSKMVILGHIIREGVSDAPETLLGWIHSPVEEFPLDGQELPTPV